ncbi:GyrI-like domain-containing protein [Paenibacillus sp. IITD108]|uniref:GyrI-like domain-containing protein n=1 Tax=Paenibacillus sp. IITD108 TaxID=3116649 RepID=UPI002F3FDD26
MQLYVVSTTRTNNFNDEQIMTKIKTVWEEASQQFGQHQNCTKYGVYYDYESDYKGDYSLGIAIEERCGESVITIPESEKYEVFKVDTSSEHGIINAWKKIWGQAETGELKRAYTYDFEKYYANGEVEIHIAIK